MWASAGLPASFRHPLALVQGSPWAAGESLFHCGPSWSAGGQPVSPWPSLKLERNLCSRTWRTSSTSFFNDIGVCRVVSSFLTLFSGYHLLLHNNPFFLFKYVVTELLLLSLMDSALASHRSVLEMADIGSIRQTQSF